MQKLMSFCIIQSNFLIFTKFTQTADKIKRKLAEEEFPSHDEHQKQAKDPPRPFARPLHFQVLLLLSHQ